MAQQEIVRRMFNAVPDALAGHLHQRLRDPLRARDQKTRQLLQHALAKAGFVATTVSV